MKGYILSEENKKKVRLLEPTLFCPLHLFLLLAGLKFTTRERHK